MKVLSSETNLSSATNVGNASVVRIFNSDSSVATVTRKDSGGSTIGSFTISAGEVVYSEKNYTDTLEGGSGLKVSKVGYSHMMSYSSYTSSGGGGGSSIITTNLVLHLDAGNSSSYSGSGTTWTDISGNSNNATLVNNPTYSSDNGGYLSFDGTNDHATLPEIDISGDEITFTVWNYGISTQLSYLFNLQGSNNPILRILLPYPFPSGTNQIYFDKGTGSGYDRINFGATNSEYQGWHHWAFTANATTGSMKIYLDGVLKHSGTGKTASLGTPTGTPQAIGYGALGYYHKGYISQILLYKKELSASEVLQNYNATKSNYHELITTNLVLHLDAGNSSSYSGSGTTWTDLSGNSNNGTLENGVSYSSSDGGYLVFDGSNDFISFADDSDFNLGTGDFTYETWIQITGSGTFMRLGSFINDADSGASPNFTLQTVRIYMYSSLDNGMLLEKNITSNTNTWYHVVFTRIGTNLKLYRNGSQIGSASGVTSNFVDDRLVIGRNHFGTAFATGHMAQARLYKGKGLTDSEVLQNYNATRTTFGY